MEKTQQNASGIWDLHFPPDWRQEMIDKATDSKQLHSELAGKAFPHPVTLVAVAKGGESIAVYRQEKELEQKDRENLKNLGGNPICTVHSNAIVYPISLYLARGDDPNVLLTAELSVIKSAGPTNYKILP